MRDLGGKQREQRHRAHPSGASGINVEAVPGPAELKLRPLEAVLCFLRAGLWIGAHCSIGGP
eukprot:13921825-Alexandrium_andersonii.AAC.1